MLSKRPDSVPMTQKYNEDGRQSVRATARVITHTRVDTRDGHLGRVSAPAARDGDLSTAYLDAHKRSGAVNRRRIICGTHVELGASYGRSA